MTQIAKMKTLTNAEEFIDILNEKDLLIYEDVQGSKIFVKWDGNKFIIKAKSINNDPLNFIDLAVQKYYNNAYIFFNTLPEYVTELMGIDWWFCFEYFPDNKPANITYNNTPKNGLILACVLKGKKYVYDYDETLEYSKLFGTDTLPIIFKGKLSKKQLEIIELYLNTKETDLEYVFGEDNFAFFFYKILNPNSDNSFLMRKNIFNDNLEKIVIKINGKSKYSFEILNPLYQKMELNNNTEHVKNYSLILLKFLEFVQLINIDSMKICKISKDELYVEFISLLFNKYITENMEDLLNWEIVVPSFFKDEKFKINTNLIKNKETRRFLKINQKIEYIFKSILGSFNTHKKKPIGHFNDTTLTLYNNFVQKIDILLDKTLKINREYELKKDDLKNFKDYFNIKYDVDTDSTGKHYFKDMYDEFDTPTIRKPSKDDKKKGKYLKYNNIKK